MEKAKVTCSFENDDYGLQTGAKDFGLLRIFIQS